MYRPAVASTSSLPKSLAVDTAGLSYVVTASSLDLYKDLQKASSLPLKYPATCLAATAKGDLVAVGSEDTKVRIYTIAQQTAKESKTLDLNRAAITATAFSRDGTHLAVGDSSGKIIVYDTSSFEVRCQVSALVSVN